MAPIERNATVQDFGFDLGSPTPGRIADCLGNIAAALEKAIAVGDLGGISNAGDGLKRLRLSLQAWEARGSGEILFGHQKDSTLARQALEPSLNEFGIDEYRLDEKWSHVTWIALEGGGDEVWVRSKNGGYLVFTVMPQNYPSIGIWLDDKSDEEVAAKFHTNCPGWDVIRVGFDLDQFLVLGAERSIMSVEELAKSDDPAHRAWAERIPVLCDQADERMRKKAEARLEATKKEEQS